MINESSLQCRQCTIVRGFACVAPIRTHAAMQHGRSGEYSNVQHVTHWQTMLLRGGLGFPCVWGGGGGCLISWACRDKAWQLRPLHPLQEPQVHLRQGVAVAGHCHLVTLSLHWRQSYAASMWQCDMSVWMAQELNEPEWLGMSLYYYWSS